MRKLSICGQKFGRLTVVSGVGTDKNGKTLWECICDCGKVKIALGVRLSSGATKSCGCLFKETIARTGAIQKHGAARRGKLTKEYIAWRGMLSRCENPEDRQFFRYGGRGIKVCKPWHNFTGFFLDMGAAPSPQHSLDRVNADGNYSKRNCRWATSKEQQNNRRDNIRLSYKGLTLGIFAWAEKTGISEDVLRSRVYAGWPTSRLLTEPVRRYTRKF